MNHYIQFKKANCKNCYKCIRHCPVKSIRFADHQAHIVKDQCVLCGKCIVVCPQNAKQVRNDLAIVKEMLASGKPVYASIAPSFAARYEGTDIESMEQTLKTLGFAGASETSIGAAIVKKRYEEMILNTESDVIISSCCHTINSLIQKYYPEALPYLAHVLSPMQAHCKHIKEAHPKVGTVFIGPCISKKEEADLYPGYVDCVLTFDELSQWLQEEGVELTPSEGRESDWIAKARLFPIPGGIIKSMDRDGSSYDYISVDGTENCIEALKNVISGKLTHCFIEMSACTGSCIGGPAMAPEQRGPISDYIAISHYARRYDEDCLSSARHGSEEAAYLWEQVLPNAVSSDSSLSGQSLHKNFTYLGHSNQMPGSSAINEILHKMGKSSPAQELNCGSCGYNTCREKAIAVYQGKADLTMCLPFLKEKAENFSDNIIFNMPSGVLVLNEDLEVQQINRAAKELFNIKSKRDILNAPVVRILNPAVYLEVMSTGKNIHDRHTYLAEYQKYTEETIIYDRTYHIIISIMRDITAEEISRIKKEHINTQTIEIADKVIEKQMRVVQEIASLLGETTAETKIALTNLKETLKNE